MQNNKNRVQFQKKNNQSYAKVYNKQQEQEIQEERIFYKASHTNLKKLQQPDSLPYDNIYLKNQDQWSYTTVVYIQGIKRQYRAMIDNNYPFTILTDEENICNQINCGNIKKDQELPSNVIRWDNHYQYNLFDQITLNIFLTPDLEFINFKGYLAKKSKDLSLINVDIRLGLGKSKPYQNTQNILDILKNSGLIKKKIFSVFLGDSYKMLDSLIVLGSYDVNLFQNSQYLIISSVSEKYYAVKVDNLIIQNNHEEYMNQVIPVSKQAILSISSPFIEAERFIIEKIMEIMSTDSRMHCFISNVSNKEHIPINVIMCQRLSVFVENEALFPTINFVVQGQAFPVTPSKYISDCYLYVDNNSEYCVTFFKIRESRTEVINSQRERENNEEKRYWREKQREKRKDKKKEKQILKEAEEKFLRNTKFYKKIQQEVDYILADYFYKEFYNPPSDYEYTSSIILGTPFMREYYTVFDEEANMITLGKTRQMMLTYTYSYFWYYTLIILVFFWAIVMITCGVYYKEQMNSIMKLVINIIKYLVFKDQTARLELLMYSIDN